MVSIRVATVQGGYGPPVGNVRVVINRMANVYGGYCPGVARVRVGDNQVATVRVACVQLATNLLPKISYQPQQLPRLPIVTTNLKLSIKWRRCVVKLYIV